MKYFGFETARFEMKRSSSRRRFLKYMAASLSIPAAWLGFQVADYFYLPEAIRPVATTEDFARGVRNALDDYRSDNGRYPTVDQGLKALVEKPTYPPLTPRYKRGGYVRSSAIVDPWGSEYFYQLTEDTRGNARVRVCSFGPDGVWSDPIERSDDICIE